MPIFDQGYQHWDGALSGHAWRWLAVARRGVRTQLKNRWTRIVLILAWLPALALGFFLAVWGLLEQKPDDWAPFLRGFLPEVALLDPKSFRLEIWTLAFSLFLSFETFMAMILVVIVGPGLISQDLRFNAMPLYLSRPLTRLDYFAGKLATIAAFLAAVMIVPAVLTYGIGLAFSLDYRMVADTYRIVPACIAYGLVVVLVGGLFMLAISSLSRKSLGVAMTWIGLWLVGSFVTMPLTYGMRLQWGPIVSITNNFARAREAILGTHQAYDSILDATEEMANAVRRPNILGGLFGRPSPPKRPDRAAPRPPRPPTDPRFASFPETFYKQGYPWQWSAYVLLGMVGLSLWVLTTRVKSLDRLR